MLPSGWTAPATWSNAEKRVFQALLAGGDGFDARTAEERAAIAQIATERTAARRDAARMTLAERIAAKRAGTYRYTVPYFVPTSDRPVTISGIFLAQVIRDYASELPAGVKIQGVLVAGEVQIESVQVEKAISLEYCYITGPIVARGCKFLWFSLSGSVLKDYLDMRSSVISGGVYLRYGFTSETSTLLRATSVTGSIDCDEATFKYDSHNLIADKEFARDAEGESCSLARSKAAALFWRDMREPPTGVVNLRNCHFDSLRDDIDTVEDVARDWPQAGNLRMSGLKYDERTSTEPGALKCWIELQDPSESRYGTYQTAIKLLSDSGQELSANEINLAKQRFIAGNERSWLNWLLRWSYIGLSEAGIGTDRAFFFTLVAFALSWVIIAGAECKGAFVPKATDIVKSDCYDVAKTCPGPEKWVAYPGFRVPSYYPPFNALGYTVDLFVPGVSYGVASDWRPVSTFMTLVTIGIRAAGVLLTGLLIVCISGLARFSR